MDPFPRHDRENVQRSHDEGGRVQSTYVDSQRKYNGEPWEWETCAMMEIVCNHTGQCGGRMAWRRVT